jgi:hypothetical protein
MRNDPAAEVQTCLLTRGGKARLVPLPKRWLGKWKVAMPPEATAAEHQASTSELVPLNYALLRMNQPMSGARYPLLAMGSRLSQASLKAILQAGQVSPVLPVSSAEVKGVAQVAAAYIDGSGRIADTPVLRPGAAGSHAVVWLTMAQLRAVSRSQEGYNLVLVSQPDDVSVLLPSAEELSGFYTYVIDDKYGYLVDGSGDLRPSGSQDALISALLTDLPALTDQLGLGHKSFTHRTAGDAVLRTRVLTLLREQGLVGDEPEMSGLVRQFASRYLHTAAVAPPTYDMLLPGNQVSATSLRACAVPATFDRAGQTNVRVTARTAEILGRPRHVEVKADVAAAPDGQGPPSATWLDATGRDRRNIVALARLVVTPDLPEYADIELDQAVRDALGIEVGENVEIAPASLHRRRWPDLLLGRPDYLATRVQVADRSTMERDVCLLEESSLELLGMQSGDEVIIEGLAEPGEPIPLIRLKAFRISEAIRKRRLEVYGGDFSCTVPSSRDALGVYPDLPWIFLDARSRALLGLGTQQLACVRIRCSRSYQLRKELREMVLVLSVAFLGLAVVLPGTVVRLTSLIGLLLTVTVIVTFRLRGRITHRTRRG